MSVCILKRFCVTVGVCFCFKKFAWSQRQCSSREGQSCRCWKRHSAEIWPTSGAVSVISHQSATRNINTGTMYVTWWHPTLLLIQVFRGPCCVLFYGQIDVRRCFCFRSLSQHHTSSVVMLLLTNQSASVSQLRLLMSVNVVLFTLSFQCHIVNKRMRFLCISKESAVIKILPW